MKSKLKAPGSTKRLKRKYDIQLSSFAFNFILRRYNPVPVVFATDEPVLGRVVQVEIRVHKHGIKCPSLWVPDSTPVCDTP